MKILQIGSPDGQGPDMGRTKVDCLGLPWPCFIFFPLIGSILLNIGLFEDHPIHIWLRNLCQILSRKQKSPSQQKKSRPKGFHRGSPFRPVSQLSEEEAEILVAEEDLLLTIQFLLLRRLSHDVIHSNLRLKSQIYSLPKSKRNIGKKLAQVLWTALT